MSRAQKQKKVFGNMNAANLIKIDDITDIQKIKNIEDAAEKIKLIKIKF